MGIIFQQITHPWEDYWEHSLFIFSHVTDEISGRKTKAKTQPKCFTDYRRKLFLSSFIPWDWTVRMVANKLQDINL